MPRLRRVAEGRPSFHCNFRILSLVSFTLGFSVCNFLCKDAHLDLNFLSGELQHRKRHDFKNGAVDKFLDQRSIPFGPSTAKNSSDPVQAAGNVVAQERERMTTDIYEAEAAQYSQADVIKLHEASGQHFVDYGGDGHDAFIAWDEILIPEAGRYKLTFHYGLAGEPRPLRLLINDKPCGNEKGIPFTATGGFTTFKGNVEEECEFAEGLNEVRLECTGKSGPNVDFMQVSVLGSKEVWRNKIKDSASYVFDQPDTGYNSVGNIQQRINSYRLVSFRKHYDPAKETDPPVLPEMLYWSEGLNATRQDYKSLPEVQEGKYMMHESDSGGFNNIRIAFEYVLRATAVSGRSFVQGVPCKWYLLDYSAEFAVNDVSNFDEYWDMQDLSRVVPVLTIPQFIAKEQARLQIPKGLDVNNAHNLSCGALYDRKNIAKNPNSLEGWVRSHSQKDQDIFNTWKKYSDSPILNCPEESEHGWRFLYGWARAEEGLPTSPDLRRFQKNHIHLRLEIAYVASRIVRELGGPFAYSCAHIRRGDFQFSESKVPEEVTWQHLQGVLLPRERLYITTDTPTQFFKIIPKVHPTFFYSSFKRSALADLRVSPKLSGMVEQFVCSLGRVFVGTPLSTFTGGIVQMRIFNDAVKNKTQFWHAGAGPMG